MTARERMVRVVTEALSVRWDNLLEAEAVVAAMEAEMGLREEATVDFCESQHRDRDGEWHYCKLPGDHESDHESDWVGSWPWDDVDGPRKKRTHRLVTDWVSDDEGDNT